MRAKARITKQRDSSSFRSARDYIRSIAQALAFTHSPSVVAGNEGELFSSHSFRPSRSTSRRCGSAPE